MINRYCIEKELEIQVALVKCARMLAEIEDTYLAIDAFLQTLADFYQADRAYIFEFSEDGTKISNTYEWCNTGIDAMIGMLQDLDIRVIDLWLEKFKNEGAFCLSSLDDTYEESSETYRILAMQKIQSLLTAPLLENKKIVGFVGVDNPRKDGKDMTLLVSVTCFIYSDIRRRKNLELLRRLSLYDSLTNVYNRNAYFIDLENLQQGHPLGVAYIDVNGLKEVNDGQGHQAGDALLSSVANKLFKAFPSGNIYRIGGDEFVVFCQRSTEAEFCKRVAQLQSSWTDEVSAAVGYHWTADSQNPQEEVALAEKQMYIEKRKYYVRTGKERRKQNRTE